MASKPKEKSRKKIEAGQQAETTSWYFLGNTELGQRFNAFINGGVYGVVSTLILIYTLFSDDIREICFPASADETFSWITLVCMIYYLLEIIAFSLFQKDYFLQYYFWLDIISTSTMCLDLIWITQYITGGGKNAVNITQISRASRAARLGTRTVRLIRLVRMIKIIKQMKLLSKDLALTEAQQGPKKPSQRLSSIQSRIVSLRNIERLSANRHTEKLPSKRWSLIKQTGCMNVLGAPREQQVSINCLPFKEQDAIVDSQIGQKHVPSMRSVEAPPKHPSIFRIQESKNKVVVLENIEEEGEDRENKKERKEGQLEESKYKSKRSRFDQTNREIREDPSDNDIVIPPESKVGARVQNEIQKNVILMIVLVLVSIPLLDGSTWFSPLAVYDHGINDLSYFAYNEPTFYRTQASQFINDASSFLNPLLYFIITTPSINDTYPDNYNISSKLTVNDIITKTRSEDLDAYEGSGYAVAFDISWYNKEIAMMNIGRTCFVCILLIVTTMLFSNDLEFAAIAPLEDMFETVKKIAIHPLNALREIEEKNLCLESIDDDGSIPHTEPKVLQNTIVKIGSLLAVGFGEAGTEIICRVIEDPAIIDVMIPGQKIMALFGFCDIRNFTDATEVLEADVMVFVNEIAAICHRVTYEHLGSPNKNIGDAFLLVWKFAQKDCKVTESADETNIQVLHTPRVSQQADLAVLALIKMIADITKAQSLQKYKANKGLQERIPNYTGVKMGFGLHVGWAIEGPIGSEYKIDASYLGSHVHMASRLEGATKGYGASMLITGDVYNLMTKNRNNLRHIDRVVPTGETAVTDLYTVDIVPKHLFDELGVRQEKHLNQKEKRLAKVCQNLARKKLSEDINKNQSTDALWNDEDIRIMQEPYTSSFYGQWGKGFKNYLSGQWEVALQELTGARALAPSGTDGPTESLIKFIQEHKGKAPQNWKGYRDFD